MTDALPDVRAPEPLFYPAFDCGCRPYLEAFTYDGWRQYRRQVKRGERAKHIPDVRDRLFCQCQVMPFPERALPLVRFAPIKQAAPPAEAEAETSEATLEPMADSERAFFESAQAIAADLERGLLDDMLSGRQAQPEAPARPVAVTAQPSRQPVAVASAPAAPIKAKPQGTPVAELMRQLAGGR